MNRILALALLVALSGCTDEPQPIAPECVEDCEPSIAPPRFEFASCIESRFSLDLDRVVYQVPDGFETRSFGAVPQRMYVVLGRCERISDGSVDESDVSVAQIGVFVTASDRGQGGNADIYGLEIVTDSPLLASVYRSQGFHVVNGTVTIEDVGALRQSRVQGDVDYQMEGEFVPFGNGPVIGSPPIPGSVAFHSVSNWYRGDRSCLQYFGTAVIQFTANQGVAAQAMPDIGPLRGTASLAFACDETVQFGNSTIGLTG